MKKGEKNNIINRSVPDPYIYKLRSVDRASGTYYKTRLPPKITELDRLKPEMQKMQRLKQSKSADEDPDESKSDCLFPKIVTTDIESKKISYIRVDLKPNDSRHSYVLQTNSDDGKSGYYMTIPKEYINNGDRSLTGMNPGDMIYVEVNYDDEHLRIYTPEGYQHRDRELDEQGRKPIIKRPATAALLGSQTGEYTDLSGFATGKKYRIIPVKTQDVKPNRAYPPKARSKNVPVAVDAHWTKVDDYLTAKYLRKYYHRGLIRQTQAEEIRIFWYPKKFKLSANGEYTKLGSFHNTDELKVVLPVDGYIKIVISDGIKYAGTWIRRPTSD